MKDPTMETSEAINGECLVFGAIHCFTGCGWIYNLLQRSEIREKYGIQGSGLGDCCTSYWCLCCALIQQDNEVKRRAIPAGPITQGYQSQKEGMQMPAPAYVQPPQHDMEQGIQQAYPAGQQPMHYPPGVQGQEKQ
ncbi:hypothetical protein RJ55_03495 [Drechmeria coniospora]|nr:hypothetical protein RJ55_03495 [Drechmeria coniospora]